MNEAPEVRAAKMMEEFASAITRLAPKHERTLNITERSEEEVSFELDNYPFTFTWGVVDRPSIVRTIPVVQFSLCIWHTVGGGRWHPPEDVDTTLIESQSVYDCIRVAFETVAKDEIRGIMENDGYEQMAKEAVTEEW